MISTLPNLFMDNTSIPRLVLPFSAINSRLTTYSGLVTSFISDLSGLTINNNGASDINANINDAVTQLTTLQTKITNAINALNAAVLK